MKQLYAYLLQNITKTKPWIYCKPDNLNYVLDLKQEKEKEKIEKNPIAIFAVNSDLEIEEAKNITEQISNALHSKVQLINIFNLKSDQTLVEIEFSEKEWEWIKDVLSEEFCIAQKIKKENLIDLLEVKEINNEKKINEKGINKEDQKDQKQKIIDWLSF